MSKKSVKLSRNVNKHKKEDDTAISQEKNFRNSREITKSKQMRFFRVGFLEKAFLTKKVTFKKRSN